MRRDGIQIDAEGYDLMRRDGMQIDAEGCDLMRKEKGFAVPAVDL